MRKLRIAFLLNPLEEMHHEDDTSFALMRECYQRGHEIFYFQSQDLRHHHNTLSARLSKCRIDLAQGVLTDLPQWQRFSSIHAVIIRKEPPFDLDYLCATYLLDLVRGKTFLMNDPSGVRSVNEKMSALHFPKLSPATLVGYEPEIFEEGLNHSPDSDSPSMPASPLRIGIGAWVVSHTVSRSVRRSHSATTPRFSIAALAPRS